eukprot:9137255-Ditylum_brightwellii.AAC.1
MSPFNLSTDTANTNLLDSIALRRGRATRFNMHNLDTWGVKYCAKNPGNTRFVFDNLDGFQLGTRKNIDKPQKLKSMCRKVGADAFAGVELQSNLLITKKKHSLHQLFRTEHDLRLIAVHNKHKDFHHHQEGGVLLMAFDQMSSMVMDTNSDPLGLCCWVSMKLLITAEVTARLVVAYIPSNSNNNRLNTVKAQHQRHL